jgi:hypothetical protein
MDSNLKNLYNIYRGSRAFLVACGPSLKDTNTSLLKNEIVFGVSLAYKKEGLIIDYHFIGDKNIFEQVYPELRHINNVENLFLSNGICQTHSYYDFLDTRYLDFNLYSFKGHGEKRFHTDVTKRIYGGGTSTFLGMQFAYYMGIQKLYVIGLDHSWDFSNTLKVGTGAGGDKLINPDKDPNHFVDDFYDESIEWYKPKIDKMAQSYKMAGDAYEKTGRVIYNASTSTKLSPDILPRIDFKELF